MCEFVSTALAKILKLQQVTKFSSTVTVKSKIWRSLNVLLSLWFITFWAIIYTFC